MLAQQLSYPLAPHVAGSAEHCGPGCAASIGGATGASAGVFDGPGEPHAASPTAYSTARTLAPYAASTSTFAALAQPRADAGWWGG
jgi:hypothetical protein